MIRLFESLNRTTIPSKSILKENVETRLPEQIDDLRDSNLEASVGLGEERNVNIPFEKIAEFFNHYKIDVSSLNPEAVKNVYRVWDKEADFEGLSDMEDGEDGKVSVELDGMYGKHWMTFDSQEQWQEYYENHILADARQAFEGLYKEYDLKSQSQNAPKDMTSSLGDTHGDVLSKLKAKMSEEGSQEKKKVFAKDLKAGDHIIGLGKGLKVIRGAQAGVSTPSGKIDLVVEYPNGEQYLKVWNKNTVIMIYEKPVNDTMSERHLVISPSRIFSPDAIKSANAIYDMHDQDVDQAVDYVKRNAADTMDAEEIIEILRNSTASDERLY